MKNFAEQQMGAVLNPYANHPEMNRAIPADAAEVPSDIRASAAQAILSGGEACRIGGKLHAYICNAILAERQRCAEIVRSCPGRTGEYVFREDASKMILAGAPPGHVSKQVHEFPSEV